MLGLLDYSLITILLFTLTLCLVVKLASTVIYNLFFHPLAKVPGPRIAGATYLYQTYYSLVGGSRFYIQIGKLHDTYGPVVRVTPDEVHLSDADNYEIINFVGSKYSKSAIYDAFGIGYSTFGTRDAKVHRIRRGALNPFFSRRRVLDLEHIIQDKVEKLSSLATTVFSSGNALNLHYAFRALSVDVFTEYGFAQCYDLLDRPDIGHTFFDMMQGIGPTMWIFQQWPALQKLALSLPSVVAAAMSPPIAQVLALTSHCRKQCVTVKEAMDSGNSAEGERSSIFQVLLSPSEKDLDYVVPTVDDLKDEAYSMLVASADTTGNTMTTIARQVLTNPAIFSRVKQELESAFPNPNASLALTKLESLPYLSACIKEGLRLSFGVTGRLPRDVPEGGQTFNGVFIPAGFTVSMSSWVLHQDPTYFPQPQTFSPDRWLVEPEKIRYVEKAFVPFGKGSRGCVGMPLASCELYITLGTLFRRYGNLRPNVLTAEDVVLDDYFAGYHPYKSTKFQVMSPVAEKRG